MSNFPNSLLIRTWFLKHVEEVISTPTGTTFEHIDYLLNSIPDKSQWLSTSINIFEHLILEVKEKNIGASVRPVLRIPLQYVDNKLASSPIPKSENQLYRQLSDEPPSIGLVNLEVFKHQSYIERYRVPMTNQFLITNEGVSAYYSEYRSSHDTKHNYEYHRSVVFEYFDPAHRLDSRRNFYYATITKKV